MSDEIYNELMEVITLANKTNSLAISVGSQVDEKFDTSAKGGS